jgi:hypothetical protein
MTGVLRKVGWCVLGLVVLVQAGCMLAVASAAAGAAGAGYLYYNGLVYRDYNANLGDAVAAVRTSLVELQFPLLKETNDTGSAYFQSQTGDGHTVRIYLDMVPSPIPSEGSVTRISIRVGFSGDDSVCSRILDQVNTHLTSPKMMSAPNSAPVVPATPPVVVAPRAPAETTPPPLAPDRLVPVAATEKR